MESRKRKEDKMRTLETENESLQSNNEELSTQLDQMIEKNTMLTDQLSQQYKKVMELEGKLLIMSQTCNNASELSSQNIQCSSCSNACYSFWPPSVLMNNQSSGVVEDYSYPTAINGSDCHR